MTSVFRSKTGSRIISNPTMTATKLRPLNKKHAETPTAPIISPASDGPITRAPLTIELLSEIALSKSSRLVISTVNACRAGISNPIAMPLSAATATINVALANPAQTPIASKNAQIICAVWVAIRIDRFG